MQIRCTLTVRYTRKSPKSRPLFQRLNGAHTVVTPGRKYNKNEASVLFFDFILIPSS